jgi:uroporphyrinogen decarboxylase
MNPQERVIRALNRQEPDRVPISDTLWPSTVARWQREGLPPDISPAEYFDYDIVLFGADVSPRYKVRTLKEDKEFIIETSPYGGVVRNRRDRASVPDFLEFPCKNRADWDKLKPRLTPDKTRVDWEGKSVRNVALDPRGTDDQISTRTDHRQGLPGYRQAREGGKCVMYYGPVGFGHIHQAYVGTEDLCMAIITDPDWVIDMYETNAALVMGMYEVMIAGGFEFDAAFLACDLGYNHGIFFSPRHYEQQLHPVFVKLFDFFHSQDIPVILHSDGRILDLVPYFVEAGLDCLNPLEAKAGMDLVQLKEQYGDKLAFMGGIDVQAMAAADPAILENEIKTKLAVAKAGGGYIYHSDHSVPDDVSFAQYQRVMDLVRKYGEYS